MKLKIVESDKTKHKDLVTCVGWSGNNELFSCGDDNQIIKWSPDGDYLGVASTFNVSASSTKGKAEEPASPVYITEFQWSPMAPGKGQSSAESYVVGATDGKLYFCSKAGKVEKVVEAHSGAVSSLKWNYEASAILSAGEDGQIKIWSKTGMLRSVLVQGGSPVYATAWAPDNDQVLYTNGRNLVVKLIQAGKKPMQWKAHDGVILKVDWNMVSGLIISAGEDRKYRIWDAYGRQLFSSSIHEHSITSLAWCPSGEMFAVGSYNTLKICDRLGWSYALSRPECGSIFNLSWTPDGTQVACAGGAGSVVFGHIMDRRYEWKNLDVTVIDERIINVQDVLKGNDEQLEFRDRIVKVSLRYGHLIVATALQCLIYSEKNWNTPAIIDMTNSGRVTCIQQCASCFVLVDTYAGIQVFTYDGKLRSSPKYPGLRAEFLTPQNISIMKDILAVKDRADETLIHLFDVNSGAPFGEGSIKHVTDILEIGLSQSVNSSIRQLIVLDKNRELHIGSTLKANFKKIGTMVDSAVWNDENDMLAAITDGKFIVWYYPNVVFVDEDIASLCRLEKDGSVFGKDAKLVNFNHTYGTVRCADGSLITVSDISPLPATLQDFARKRQWEQAIRLCRHLNMKELWACLAVMAVFGEDLNTAEVAYAAIDEIHKVQFICNVKSVPSSEGRAAELALLRKQPREAESILLSGNLVFRAIKMWIDLFNWERALEIAIKYKTHIDTVIYFRGKYLRALEAQETSKRFLQYSQGVEIEWEKIKLKISIEEEEEHKKPRCGQGMVAAH